MSQDELTRRVSALRRASIFAGLDEPLLHRVAETMTEVELPAGHVLIESRTAGAGLFVIDEGTVSVEPRGAEPRELGPGEVVGELALLTRDGTRTARVQAKTAVRCLALDRTSFHSALAEEPRLAIALLQTAVERLAAQLPS
ncbi:MAG: cyclic nucleotide-binding domain-containing protein [Gaiellaceae bacterium]